MLDHISFGVSDLARSTAFYDAVLAPLGYVRVWSRGDAAGYGPAGRDDGFAIKLESADTIASAHRTHLAFAAPSRDSVIAFHAAGMAHGAVDEGPAALCPEYGDGYFAAFLRDPDGYRLEAVRHETDGTEQSGPAPGREPA
jgi:catechol 2,3-dioxygenase-like lactoylglutathione lyase family enzyme